MTDTSPSGAAAMPHASTLAHLSQIASALACVADAVTSAFAAIVEASAVAPHVPPRVAVTVTIDGETAFHQEDPAGLQTIAGTACLAPSLAEQPIVIEALTAALGGFLPPEEPAPTAPPPAELVHLSSALHRDALHWPALGLAKAGDPAAEPVAVIRCPADERGLYRPLRPTAR